jgi:nitrous oxidase accessory protein NosD
MPTLLVHRDVDAHLAELDVSLRDAVRQKVVWAETQLAMTGRTLRVKGTRAQAWRRTPVRGNEYYLWWAPTDEVGAGSADLGPAIFVRDLRHHDNLAPPAPAALPDYHVVNPRELDPRSALQTSIARGAPLSSVAATIVRGQPGTGKTLSLLYAARDLAASQRILYVTYTPRLVEEALLFARANGIDEQLDVMTLAALLAAIRRVPSAASWDDPGLLAQHFESMVRTLDSAVVGAWSGMGRSLWAEARACLVGMALPFAWRRGPIAISPCEMLDLPTYRKVSGLNEDVAERAHHIADIAQRRGLLSDQTNARAALDALRKGDAGRLELGRVSAVLVDEVQDLTPVEIALLLEVVRAVARPSRRALFIAAGDDTQTVHPSGFEWGLAKDLIHQRLGHEPSEVVLDHAMRNPRAVWSLVQRTGSLYKTLSKELRPGGASAGGATSGASAGGATSGASAGGATSGAAAPEGSAVAEAGRILWCEPPEDPDWKALLDALVMTPGRALVTLARPVPLGLPSASSVAFAPVDIKGLERQTVVVTGLSETLDTLDSLTTRGVQEGRLLEGLEARYLIDGIRVALSRATETLVLLGKAPKSPLAARIDLARDIVRIGWDDLLRLLQEDDLSESERAYGFLDEAREHEARGDAKRALFVFSRAEAIARGLDDPALTAAVREIGERLDAAVRPRVVVAPTGGDFTSLTAAIDAAKAGARIFVRPGTYSSSFTIDKDLTIIGDGERASVVLESDMVAVAVVDCNVVLENLTIVGRKGGNPILTAFGSLQSMKKAMRWVGKAFGVGVTDRAATAALEALAESDGLSVAVTVIKGALRLRGCDIDPQGAAGIVVSGEGHVHAEDCKVHHATVGVFAAPTSSVIVERSEVSECRIGIAVGAGSQATVRASMVRDTEKEGIYVNPGADVLLEKNELSGTKGAAIHVVESTRVVVRGNHIHHCQGAAIRVLSSGGGTFEDNDIEENETVGFWVRAGADLAVRKNRIRGSGTYGIAVDPKGRGTFEDNDIVETKGVGLWVGAGAEPIVRSNRIRGGMMSGIVVSPNGRGTFEKNQIVENTDIGFYTDSGATVIVRGSTITGNGKGGLLIGSGVRGTFEENDIFANQGEWGGIGVQLGACPVVRKNRVHQHQGHGVIYKGGEGVLEENEIFENGDIGVFVLEGAPTARSNHIHHNKEGIVVADDGGGLFEDNEIYAQKSLGVRIYGASPVFRRNRIQKAPMFGVFIIEGGATFEENDISEGGTQTSGANVGVSRGADPVFRGNRIHHGRVGVWVLDGAKGVFEGNEIVSSSHIGVLVKDGSAPVLRGNRIHDGKDFGVLVQFAGGTIIDNDIFRNRGIGVRIQSMDVVVKGNRIKDNAGGGVLVQPDTKGLLEGNEIATNKQWGLMVVTRSDPTVRGNRVHGSPVGILVTAEAKGTYAGNDVRGNTRLGLAVHQRAQVVHCEGNLMDPGPRDGGEKGRAGRKRGGRR